MLPAIVSSALDIIHPTTYTIIPATFECLSTVSYLMSRERLKVPSTNLNPFPDAAFSLQYTNELKRLEKNFPPEGGPGPHRVAMAVDDENKLVGYIDIDKRFRTNVREVKRLPPPFISDLVVDENWRRKGVAAALLRYAEYVCFNPKEWYTRASLLKPFSDSESLHIHFNTFMSHTTSLMSFIRPKFTFLLIFFCLKSYIGTVEH